MILKNSLPVLLLLSLFLVGTTCSPPIIPTDPPPTDPTPPDPTPPDPTPPDPTPPDPTPPDPTPPDPTPPDPTPPPSVGPYSHVVPADVGVTIGVGVTAAAPTTPYTGSLTIKTPGTVIENVVITGCLDLRAANITLRNVIVNCDSLYPLNPDNAPNFLVENSKIVCTSSSKIVRSSNDVHGMTIRKSELIGCQDLFYIEGNLDGMLIEDNYLHSMVGSSRAHSDGFQIGEASPATGTITIRGNYFDPDNPTIGKTDILFSTNNSTVHVIMENNYFMIWGWYTLRNSGKNSPTTIRNNVYAQEFKAALPADGSPSKAFRHWDGNPALSTFTCNRYEDGTFVEQQYVSDVAGRVTYSIANCATYP